jgi:hypothetical protein
VNRLFALAILFVTVVIARQDYSGLRPPRKDTVYLVHADELIATEADVATKQASEDDVTYIVAGERSKARTPLASPTLVIDAENLSAEKLRLFRLDVRNGHREVSFHYDGKGGAIPLRVAIANVAKRLYRIDVLDSLIAGEYALSPDGANDVFCFEVF